MKVSSFLPSDRVTETEQIIKEAKRAKTPGPNHYKKNFSRSSRERKIIGTIKSNSDQLQMFPDRAYHASKVPGHKYKINNVSRKILSLTNIRILSNQNHELSFTTREPSQKGQALLRKKRRKR